MAKPPPKVLALPLEERAEMALREAVEEVIIEHAQRGQSIFIWRDGKVVELGGEELQREAERIIHARSGKVESEERTT